VLVLMRAITAVPGRACALDVHLGCRIRNCSSDLGKEPIRRPLSERSDRMEEIAAVGHHRPQRRGRADNSPEAARQNGAASKRRQQTGRWTVASSAAPPKEPLERSCSSVRNTPSSSHPCLTLRAGSRACRTGEANSRSSSRGPLARALRLHSATVQRGLSSARLRSCSWRNGPEVVTGLRIHSSLSCVARPDGPYGLEARQRRTVDGSTCTLPGVSINVPKIPCRHSDEPESRGAIPVR